MSFAPTLDLDSDAELVRLRELREHAGRAVTRSLREEGIATDTTSDEYVAGVAAYFAMVEGSPTGEVPRDYFETPAETKTAASLSAANVIAAAERLARAVQRRCEAIGDHVVASFARSFVGHLVTRTARRESCRPRGHGVASRAPRRSAARTPPGDPSDPSSSPERAGDGLQAGAVLLLHGVDVEDYASRVLTNYTRRRGIPLRPHEREDALAFLVVEAWELSREYDGLSSFRGFLSTRLGFALIDWLRKQLGDNRYKVGHVRVDYNSEATEYLNAETPDVADTAIEAIPLIPCDKLSVRARETLRAVKSKLHRDGDLAGFTIDAPWSTRTTTRRVAELRAELDTLGVTTELAR